MLSECYQSPNYNPSAYLNQQQQAQQGTDPQVDRKDVKEKADPLLIPHEAVRAYSKISDFGAEKYGNRETWKNSDPEEGVRRYLAAAVRHAFQARQTGDIDHESELPHVYAVLWNAAVAVWHYERFKECRIVSTK